MKKFILFMGLILSLIPNARADDNVNKQEFVNPIFNQPLEPLGRTSTWTYLTPTSIKSMTPLDKNKVAMTGECELVENEQNHITMLCDIFWHNPDEKGWKTKISYYLKEIISDTCLDVEEVSYEITKRGYEKLSTSHYCIPPSNYILSESD